MVFGCHLNALHWRRAWFGDAGGIPLMAGVSAVTIAHHDCEPFH